MAQPDVRLVARGAPEARPSGGTCRCPARPTAARLALRRPSLSLQRRRSNSHSSSRPTRAVKPLAWSASKRLSTGLSRSAAQARTGVATPLRSFEPEIPKFEEIAEEPSRPVGNDDPIRLRYPLQPRREVRRLADDAALLRLARADEIADHDQTGRDPDAHLQGEPAAVTSFGTASTMASPARTARSASSSWASG